MSTPIDTKTNSTNRGKNTYQPSFSGISPENINNIASAAGTGLKMLDGFLTQISPHVNEVLTVAQSVIIPGIQTQTQHNANIYTTQQDSRMQLKLDTHESNTYIYVAVEIPGIIKENCNLKLENGYLVIEVKSSHKQDGFDFLKSKEYINKIALSSNIDKTKIKAHYLNGMLYITITKADIDSDNKINILD